MNNTYAFPVLHKITRTRLASSIETSCTCGRSFESNGTDYSSRSAVLNWERDHKGGTR